VFARELGEHDVAWFCRIDPGQLFDFCRRGHGRIDGDPKNACRDDGWTGFVHGWALVGAGEREVRGSDPQPELFFQLAAQRVDRELARFELAARLNERRRAALADDQRSAVAPAQEGDGDLRSGPDS